MCKGRYASLKLNEVCTSQKQARRFGTAQKNVSNGPPVSAFSQYGRLALQRSFIKKYSYLLVCQVQGRAACDAGMLRPACCGRDRSS